jgi:hypothetical protein
LKTETPNYIFTTPPDSPVAALTILQKPIKGAPIVQLQINNATDVAALLAVLTPPKQ